MLLASNARRRGLTRLQLFMMGFGAIVGVGWITILGQWLKLAGPGGSVIALVLGALAMLLVAGNYGLLARQDLLSSGGEIGALAASSGAGSAFIATAALALACLSIVAFEAVSAGWIMVTLLPALQGERLYAAFGHDVHVGTVAIAVGGIGAIALLNVRSIGETAKAQNAVVLLKIAVAVIFCAAGVVRGSAANLSPLLPDAAASATTVAGILTVAATMPLWYAGFNVLALLAGERDDAVRAADIGGVMKASIVASALFYICVVLAASAVVPWPSLIAAPLPAATAFRQGLSSALLANLVLVAGLLGVISAWIACFAGSVRVITALRRQLAGQPFRAVAGAAPVVPARSTIVAVAVISVLLSLNGRAALVPIVNVAALGYGLVYLFVSRAAWKHSARPSERIVSVLGMGVSAFMSSYVVWSAVSTQGWRAPEIPVIAVWVTAWAVLWRFRMRRS